jgi:hypothetical protein
MKKPPIFKPQQVDFVKTAVRLPPQLHKELKETAEMNGSPLNAEIIARLMAAPVQEKLDSLATNDQEIKSMLRELLDK